MENCIIERLLKNRRSDKMSDEEYKELLTELYWDGHHDGMVEAEERENDV